MIVNVSSMYGRVASPNIRITPYTASKHGESIWFCNVSNQRELTSQNQAVMGLTKSVCANLNTTFPFLK